MKVLKAWGQFFFAPISPATIGLFRIVFGLVVIDALVGKLPDRELFYSQYGLVSAKTADLFFQELPNFLKAYLLVPDSDPALKIYFLVLIFAATLLTIGLFTRGATIVTYLGVLALSNRNLFAENMGDDLLRINLFFLMFAPAGAAYSVDQWIKFKRGKTDGQLVPQAPWAQRLLQLQLAYVYLDSVWLKLGGRAWFDGTAIFYALNYLELRRFNINGFFAYFWQIKIATWGVLMTEAAMGTLIWIKKLRYWVMALGLAFHIAINLTMQFPIFQYVMIASMITFIEPDDVAQRIAWFVAFVERLKLPVVQKQT